MTPLPDPINPTASDLGHVVHARPNFLRHPFDLFRPVRWVYPVRPLFTPGVIHSPRVATTIWGVQRASWLRLPIPVPSTLERSIEDRWEPKGADSSLSSLFFSSLPFPPNRRHGSRSLPRRRVKRFDLLSFPVSLFHWLRACIRLFFILFDESCRGWFVLVLGMISCHCFGASTSCSRF